MIYLYYGEDRVGAKTAIVKLLGEDYELLDAEEYDLAQARDVFYGASLFGEINIVLRNLSLNKPVFAELEQFLDTPHQVVLWEEKLDSRTSLYKKLSKDKRVTMREFTLAKPNTSAIFNIYTTALRDGKKAVAMLREVREKDQNQDPYMFFGLLVSQAIKNYERHPSAKEKRALVELSKLDMQMKGDSKITQPWLLIESFLLQASLL